ncbi:lysophospholipid acyltransferase family protein [Demetria terragena]|uniref:lysophospholipid acyltransferase family protein n=1 Tax=Demetria terragena TaxID=63959 RepID=UPI0003602B94|nr:lysophospholipid acyltransferase family protein [Demetria terragena]
MSEPSTPRRRTTKKAATAKKSPAKKAPAKKAPASKSGAAKSTGKPQKKPAAKKTTAAKLTPKSSAATPAELGAVSRAPRRRPPRGAVRAAAAEQAARSRPALHAVPDLATPDPTPEAPQGDGDASLLSVGTLEQGVEVLIGLLRAAGKASGLAGDDLEQRVARTLAYLRRRVAGDYPIDEFGFDPEFAEEVWLPLLRPIYQRWFRVELVGVENLPKDGSALLVANHSGTVPVDGLMLQVAVHDAIGRHLRALGADLVFSSPFIGDLARKAGSTLAANADVERLLAQGELAAVFPEGFKGVGKGFSERYRLQRFGRGGFVSAALRSGVPIIPCSIVGAEEIYPMVGNLKSLARVLGFPYFPITPFFPLLGPLGAIPLPSKWIIEFGEPIDTATLGAEAAEDPMLVFDLTDQVRETIQQSLYSLLLRRRSVFF